MKEKFLPDYNLRWIQKFEAELGLGSGIPKFELPPDLLHNWIESGKLTDSGIKEQSRTSSSSLKNETAKVNHFSESKKPESVSSSDESMFSAGPRPEPNKKNSRLAIDKNKDLFIRPEKVRTIREKSQIVITNGARKNNLWTKKCKKKSSFLSSKSDDCEDGIKNNFSNKTADTNCSAKMSSTFCHLDRRQIVLHKMIPIPSSDEDEKKFIQRKKRKKATKKSVRKITDVLFSDSD